MCPTLDQKTELCRNRNEIRSILLRYCSLKNPGAGIQEQEMKSYPYSVKRPLYAKYPEIDARLIEFKHFAGYQRFHVSRIILQECARMDAEPSNIRAFKASNG